MVFKKIIIKKKLTFKYSRVKCSPDWRLVLFKFNSTPTALATIWTDLHGADPGR